MVRGRFWGLSDPGGGAAGNRNSGIAFGVLGDLRGPLQGGVLGEVDGPVILPNLSGGYEALNNGELVCLGAKDAGR